MMIEILNILTPILMLCILLLASVGSDKKDTTGKTTCIKCDGAVEVEK